MGDEVRETTPGGTASLRTGSAAGSPAATAKRFDIFLIDTGWNQPVSKLVRSHLPTLHQYQKQDSLYILTTEQSVEILRREPALIGRDPTLLLYDLHAAERAGHRRISRVPHPPRPLPER